MPRGKLSKGKPKYTAKGNGANLGFEEKLWQAADKMRGHPPDKEEKATQTVLEQAELLGKEWAA